MEEPTPTAPEAPNDPCPHCGQPVGDAWLVCAWCGEQIAAPAELPVGATLSDGRYEVLGIIGRGGFGITYEMGDTRLKRRVAVKELFPDSAVRHGSMVLTPPHARVAFRASKDRFLREARVLARFTHPGIVRVYEVFEEHGTAYLVMERLSGRTLVDVMRARSAPFTEDEVVDVAGRVAAALRPVHAAGVLHRDINPSNVMVTEHGRIVLIDFGLARDFDLDQTMGMTRMVTPGYAPLEQYRGEGRFGPSTDVYGLAATIYRLSTGKVPVAAVARDAGEELPAPHRVNPAISKAVSDAVLDGLELEPGHRPQDLDSFLSRMGIRRLPEGQRSVLLGSPGATPADLAPAAEKPRPPELVDPGPAVVPAAAVATAVAAAADVPALGSNDGDGVPRSQLATEAVAPRPSVAPAETVAAPPPASAAPPAAPAAPTPPPAAERTAVDPDLTRQPGVPVPADLHDPDRTRVPAPMAPDSTLPTDGEAGAGADGVDAPIGGRAKVTVPLFALAVVAGSAAPILVLAVVVGLVLPTLATIGDGVARRRRASLGTAPGWGEAHLPAPVIGVARFVRNVGVAIVRTSPILGVTAVLLAGWYAMAQTSLPQGFLDVTLRLVGGGAVAAILLTSREGSPRFRSGLGIEQVVARSLPGGKVSERLIVAWIIIAMVIAIALWLSPDAFPLR